MPSRLIQVASADRAESETAGQMADALLWHLENRIEVLTGVLDRMRLNANEARERLRRAERLFKDEPLLHLLGRCRNRVTHLRQRLATVDGKLTEVQWAGKRRSLSNLHASMTAALHDLRHKLADTLLPQLFRGRELAALQHALHSLDGVKRVDRALLDLLPTAGGPATKAVIRAMSTTGTMISVGKSALGARERLERTDQIDADLDLRSQTVFNARARADLEALLRMDAKMLADLERGIRARPNLWRVAEERGLTAPLDETLPAPEAGPVRRGHARPPDNATAGSFSHAAKQPPTHTPQQPPTTYQPPVDRTVAPELPINEAAAPLKLGEDDDGMSVLAKRSNKQLLAIRSATTEELTVYQDRVDAWAVAQTTLLRRGLKAIDAKLSKRDVEKGKQNQNHRRRNRGFEL